MSNHFHHCNSLSKDFISSKILETKAWSLDFASTVMFVSLWKQKLTAPKLNDIYLHKCHIEAFHYKIIYRARWQKNLDIYPFLILASPPTMYI